ncbi:MAG: VanZ family protein [Blautia massiliensis (ex Durand et al. 2017)]
MLLMLIIPVVLTIAPVMLYQIVMLLAKRKSTSTHYTWTYIMMIYIWLVISVTGIGSIWDIISKGGLMATFQQANVSLIPFQSDGIFTYCMNVIMLMPLGFLLPYIWKNFRNPLKVALTGFLFSVFIEFSQLPTNRLSDIDDLIMNTLGAVLGYVVWKLIGNYFFNKKEKQRTVSLGKCEPAIYLTLACICNFLLYNWAWFL